MFQISFAQDYNAGLKCFSNADYVCAKNHFSLLIETHHVQDVKLEYAYYYLFLSALNLYHSETDYLFNIFIEKFPFSPKKEDAFYYMGRYLFEKKNYKELISLLTQINLYQFSHTKSSDLFFYLGYSAYQNQDYELAKNSFYELMDDVNHKHHADAIFYNSQILFLEEDFERALSGFKDLKLFNKYANEIPYYITNILFMTNRYKDLIDYLEPILDTQSCNHYIDLILLHAKSCYQLEEYDAAIVYFEEYKEARNDTLTRIQLYEMGMSYYHKGLYGFAINFLNKIMFDKNDSIEQYAFYYLGDSYSKIENYLESMNAFKSASVLNLDSLIQYDAFYQFVNLCYKHTHSLYDPVEYLTQFIEKYPNAKHIDEIYTYLANTHINTHNYEQAILVLEKSNLLSQNLKNQYQKICFYKGVQLYNDALYNESINYFDKSIHSGNKNTLYYKAHYWKGEAYFNLKLYNRALESYQIIDSTDDKNLYLQSLYSQGYCYLKTRKYNNSIKKFKIIVEHKQNNRLIYDCYMRIADNYFLLMNYDLSTYFYNQALRLSGFEDDYAYYKKSTAYVLLTDYHNAINSFKELMELFPNSNYVDDALFDLGNVYIISRNFDLSIQTFSSLIKDFKNSLFYAPSKLKLGLVYYLKEEDKKALEIFKGIINEFPNTPTYHEALRIIKNIYNEIGANEQFLALMQQIDHDYTKSELDSASFYSAELQYMKSNYENAVTNFKTYLSYYPEGVFYLEANYFLYKSYEQLGDLENAIQVLQGVKGDAENKYTLDIVSNLAKMSYKLGRFISSEDYFNQLLGLASELDLKKEALLGLLESQFQLYKYSDIISTISNSIQKDLFSGKDYLRVRYLRGYSSYKVNSTVDALSDFKWLIDNSEGALRAESCYYASIILHQQKKYIEAQKIIFQLINELPTYTLWIDRSLLLLSKNYIMQEDMFQAQHVLLELQKKCQTAEILEEVDLMLMKYFSSMIVDTLRTDIK